MSDSIHLSKDLNLSPSASAPNAVNHWPEIFSEGKIIIWEAATAPVVAGALALGAIALMKPLFERKAEAFAEKSLTGNAVVPELTILDPEPNLAIEESSAKMPCPSPGELSAAESPYRYFHQSRGLVPELYRFPANSKDLFEQKYFDVERYHNGQWHPNQAVKLMDEALKGWFSEEHDELSSGEALLRI